MRPTRHGLLVVPLLASLLALGFGCAGSTANSRAGASLNERAVDALFHDYAGPGSPGASVVVVHDGQVVLRRAYGLAELEPRVPVTPGSNFRLASLSKQFTSTALLLLVREGRLRLEDRVVDVLPGFPPELREVRIHHLLQHTSGLWDYEDFVPPTQATQVHDRDVLDLVAKANRTYFPPGSAVRYSNSGYAVLALIVQQVSGMPFARFLRERVLLPAGMPSTVAHEDGVSTVERRAYGYAPEGGRFVPRDQSPTSAVLGDGGVYSSVEDLIAWDRALDAHTLLGAELQARAWTPPVLPGGQRSTYGFGWFVDDDGGRQRLSHHGETCGFTNALLKYPEQRLTVIVLTNRAGGAPWDLAQQVADLWLGGAVTHEHPWPFLAVPNAH